MKITNIRTKESGNTISLLADCKIRATGWDTVYFAFDKKYKDFLCEDASSFAAGLLIPSMSLGEDLVIEGAISKKLYEGMQRVMEIMLAWPFGMKRIAIKAQKIVPDEAHPTNVASFFSGGVDSFYTYLKHKDDKQDGLSHFILMKGSDITLRNKRLLEETERSILEVAKEGNIEAISLETNLQTLLEPIVSPDYTHGGCLAAVGLSLRKGFKKIYIASTFSYKENFPYGSHPDLDKYWSSEALLFEHDGAEATRFEKIDWQIARSPVALKHLRVCFMNVNGKYNCGKCEKCYRTMIALYAAGKLDEAKTFPHAIDLKRVTYLISHGGFLIEGNRQNLAALEVRHLDPQLQEAIRKGLANLSDPKNTIKERTIKKMIYLDHMYLRGQLFKLWLSIVHPY